MPIDVATALALMQYGDSAYPAGGFAFSWGVEGLAADGLLDGRQDLEDFIWEYLRFRWNSMDRPLLARGYRDDTPQAVAAVDHFAEVSTASEPMRDGSRRAGRALLGVSARRGGPLSVAYRALLATDSCLGHLPVTQAVVFRDGSIGHIEAQEALQTARPTLAELLMRPLSEDVVPSSFTPLIDIAVSRARSRPVRMFTT